MATANRPYGRVLKGHTLPYGTLANVSPEIRKAYYCHGYVHDDDMPPLPCPPQDALEPYICAEEELFKKERTQVINDVLDTLAHRAAKVLRLRFGFDSSYDLTLEEIGRTFDVGKERVRQIEAKALRSLKHPSRCDPLRELVEPTCQEDKIIKFNKSKPKPPTVVARHEEITAVKHKLVQAHEQKDADWLVYFARVEPELYAEFEKRVRSKLEIYQWLR